MPATAFQLRRYFPIVFMALLLATGCKPSPDACPAAVRHYETQDLPDADIVKLFQRMSDKGDVRGKLWIARFYFGGRCSMPQDMDLAQKMAKDVIAGVRKLAEKGDVEAQFLMGAAYQEGLGVDMDSTEAVNWFEKAAAAGHMTAMNNLGLMLAYGHGAGPDIERARQLFSKAAGLGSVRAAKNVVAYINDRDDSKRWADLRSVSLVKALGMDETRGITFLVEHGLISDPKGFEERDYPGYKQDHFKNDGLLLQVGSNGRITVVEGQIKGSHASEQTFKGDFPFGLAWDDTVESARQKLGDPDDFGSVELDNAYGMAYRADNLIFSVMFSTEGEKKLKIFRAYERWAVKYPDQ